MNKIFRYNSIIFALMILSWGIFHILLEWAFLMTGFNFLTQIVFIDKIKVLFLSIITFVPYLLGIVSSLVLCAMVLNRKEVTKKIFNDFYFVMFNFFFAITIFLLIDNFTYNVFNFKLQYQGLYGRFGYVALFLLSWFASYHFFMPAVIYWRKINDQVRRKMIVTSLMFLLPVFLTSIFFIKDISFDNWVLSYDKNKLKKVSLVFIAMDGVESKYLPFYGHIINTTPNLNKIARESLVLDNAFTNSGNSFGATIALLTGKSPEKTKVSLHVATKLTANDRKESFIAILNQVGLKLWSSYFGFGENFSKLNSQDLLETWMTDDLTNDFNSEIANRLISRLQFILGNDLLENIDLDPNQTRRILASTNRTMQEIETAKAFINNNKNNSFLLHLHLMITHVGVNHPKKRFYSVGLEETDANWEPFFLDSIVESDRYIGEIFDQLKESKIWDNTIVVFYSDHGRDWNPRKRVPIMIRFPNGEFSGRITQNTQLIDIAPTIVEYMGVKNPDWFDGLSLLHPDKISEDRTIYSITGRSEGKRYWFEYGSIQCEKYYGFDINGPIQEEIEGSTDRCSSKFNVDQEQIIDATKNHYADLGHNLGVIDINEILRGDKIKPDEKDKLLRRVQREEKILAQQIKERKRQNHLEEEKKQQLAKREKEEKLLKKKSSEV